MWSTIFVGDIELLQDLQGGACHVAERHHWNHGLVLSANLRQDLHPIVFQRTLSTLMFVSDRYYKGKEQSKSGYIYSNLWPVVCKAIFTALS